MSFLAPLIERMMQPRPEDRPSADEALAIWKRMRPQISRLQLSWRLKGRDEGLIGQFFYDCIDAVHCLGRFVGLTPLM
jgi:hypothetical protein